MNTDHNGQNVSPTRGPQSKGSPPEPATGGAVLVVDDNPVIRQIFHRALVAEGFRVAEADNGTRALAAMESGQPGLVVLDLLMPEMDGFKFLTQMRRRPEWQAIPVLVFTAKPLNEEEKAFVAKHAQHFQRKGESAASDVVRLAAQFLKQPIG
ncbi:MAG: response regulator [Verrucomicrobia bacterium]|nr:response regulator [Verrucomicrobiota bacterium]